MLTRIFALVVALGSLSLACGGNVAVSSGGAGGSATTTGTGTATSTGTTTSTSTSTGTGTGTGTQSFDACAHSTDCTVAENGCCGWCGKPSLSQFTAVNKDQLAAFAAWTCPDPGAVGCPNCVEEPGASLGSHCEAGHCEAFDAVAMSTCQSDDDCVLRHGTLCCEQDCSDASLLAVSKSAAAQIAAWMCETDEPCSTCPAMPGGPSPMCISGVCKAILPPK